MAVLLEQTMPEGVDLAMLDDVTTEMNVTANPPKGMVVHVHLMENGRVKVVDVWESAADFEAFRNDRLGPALEKVAQRRGITITEQPQTTISDVYAIVRGAASLRDAVTTQSKLLAGRLSEEVNKRRGGAKA